MFKRLCGFDLNFLHVVFQVNTEIYLLLDTNITFYLARKTYLNWFIAETVLLQPAVNFLDGL